MRISRPEEIPWPFSRLYSRITGRVFTKWFRKIAEDIKDSGIYGTILDIGTGPGRLPVEIAKKVDNADILGIDLSKDMIKMAKKNADKAGLSERIKFKVANAYSTGFEDNSIDLVVCIGVIHHLREPLNLFNEIFRILKSGGRAWIFDGRKDVTKAEFTDTVRQLGIEKDLPLRLWIITKIWPFMHVGCKTEVYISGNIGQALKESIFEDYEIKKEGVYVRIELVKP
ncbi:MAG: class I SAM-dependent methyltransferase [Dehalococcoidia bacterium]|nr:MAG: class I SAM-dependent methyltransferase [Dehalococcoidia bacterium]